MIGSMTPSHLLHFDGRWVLLANEREPSPHKQTTLFGSVDGTTWERIGVVDLDVLEVRPTAFGLFVAGTVGKDLNGRWFTALSTDAHSWRMTELPLGWTSPVHGVLVDDDRVVLVVNEDVDGFSANRRLRMLSSTNAVDWQAEPTPPCAGAGSIATSAIAVEGAWAIVVEREWPVLARSTDKGASWSCTLLAGAAFESQPTWGPPYIAGFAEVRGEIALVGGRVTEPGAKGNWAAAVWYARVS
jgi:hypothetical protein